jgi:hypothetical protein
MILRKTLADEDYELKRLSWTLLYSLSFEPAVAAYLRDAGMIRGMNPPKISNPPKIDIFSL